MRCDAVVAELPLIAGGEEKPTSQVGDHLGRCLPCRAELVRYRRLLKALSELADVDFEVPEAFVTHCLNWAEGIGEDWPSSSGVRGGRRLAYLFGIAGAAGAASVVIAKGWSRPRLAS